MKRTSAVALAIVSALFFLGLAAFAVWRGIDARSNSYRTAQERFQILSRALVAAHNGGGSFGSEAFLQTMRAELAKEGAPLAILVNSSVTGEALYLAPSPTHFAVRGSGERGIALLAIPSWSTQLFSLHLSLSDGSRVVFQAVYPTLTWGQLSRIMSECLYLIAAFFLILLLALIIQTIASALRAGKEPSAQDSSVMPIEPFIPSGLERSERQIGMHASFGADSPFLEEEDYPIPDLDGQGERSREGAFRESPAALIDHEFPPFDLPDPDSLEETQTESLVAGRAEGQGAETRPSRGLYDPETGVGWDDFLSERLGAEISRAKATGLDISFALFSAIGRDRDLPLLASDIIAYFSFRDLAFSWEGRGIALILPGKTIEEALSSCQDFLDKGMAGARGGLSVRIGLSSASERSIEAAQLLEEAAGALERALQSEDSPIIGFKADPERYASYLSGRL